MKSDFDFCEYRLRHRIILYLYKNFTVISYCYVQTEPIVRVLSLTKIKRRLIKTDGQSNYKFQAHDFPIL